MPHTSGTTAVGITAGSVNLNQTAFDERADPGQALKQASAGPFPASNVGGSHNNEKYIYFS